MKLKAMMITIEVELTDKSKRQTGKVREIDFENDKVTITEVDESQYRYDPKDIILGIENDDKLFVTKTHFRVKGRYGFAILGFKILDDAGVEFQKSQEIYEISSPSIDDEFEERTLKFFNGYFFDSPLIKVEKGKVKYCNELSPSSIGVLNPGHFYLIIRKKSDSSMIAGKYRVEVLPSSISFNDFENMIGDLVSIRQELVMLQATEKDKNKGKEKQNTLIEISETYEDALRNILSELDTLSYYLHKINKKPKGVLFSERVLLSRNKVKRFDGPIIADYYGQKEKVRAFIKTENYNIYENRLFYYAIQKLYAFFQTHIADWKMNYLKSEKNLLERRIKAFLHSYGDLNLEDVEKLIYKAMTKPQNSEEKQQQEKSKAHLFDILINNKHTNKNDSQDDIHVKIEIKISNQEEIKPQVEKWGNFYIDFKGKDLFVKYVPRKPGNKFNRELVGYTVYEKDRIIDTFSCNCLEGSNGLTLSLLGNEFQNELLNLMMGKGFATVVIDAVIETNNSTTPYYSKNKNIYSIALKRILGIEKQEGNISLYSRTIKDLFVQYGNLILADAYLYEVRSYQQKRKDLIVKINTEQNLFLQIKREFQTLLKLPFFSNVSERKENFRMTQIISNDHNYFRVYKELVNLNERFRYLDLLPKKEIIIKKLDRIYEYWILVTMVHILVKRQWKLKSDSLITFIDDFLESNHTWDLDDDDKPLPPLILEHDINNWQNIRNGTAIETNRKVIMKIAYNNKLEYKYDKLSFKRKLSQKAISDGPNKRPDFKIDISLMEGNSCLITKHFYLDAKYRSYGDQGKNGMDLFIKEDIGGVAIDKYIEAFIDTDDLRADASFIVHTDKDPKYTYFGGFYDEEINGKLNQVNNDIDCKINWRNEYDKKSPKHRYGGFCCLPNNLNGLITYLKMILEYHFSNCGKTVSIERKTKYGIDKNTYDAKLYEVCWECGNSNSVYCAADFDLVEEKLKNNKHLVLVNVKKTTGGNIKFYYKCNGCGNFWVRTMCEANKHPLIKHTENNYHVPEDDDIWYVKCPKCDPIIL